MDFGLSKNINGTYYTIMALYPQNTDEDCYKSSWLMEIVSDNIIWTEVR